VEPKLGGRHQFTRPRKANSCEAFNVPIGDHGNSGRRGRNRRRRPASKRILRCGKGARGTSAAGRQRYLSMAKPRLIIKQCAPLAALRLNLGHPPIHLSGKSGRTRDRRDSPDIAQALISRSSVDHCCLRGKRAKCPVFIHQMNLF